MRGADGGFAYGVTMCATSPSGAPAGARQKLLLDELNHRVKNTLATVQSLAAQTCAGLGSAEAGFAPAFEPRLLALSSRPDASHPRRGGKRPT